MIQFIEYLRDLTYTQGILLLLLLFIVMAIIPYYKFFYALVRLVFKPVKPEIHSFELRYAPDNLIGRESSPEKEYYLLAADYGFILEGSKMMLSWKVSGAYRVDLHPFGKDLTGNGAYVIASVRNRVFKLTAFGPVRKVEKIIEIPEDKFVNLLNTKLSLDKSFTKRLIPNQKTLAFTTSYLKTKILSNFLSEHKINYPQHKRLEFTNSKSYEFKPIRESLCRNIEINKYITKYSIIHSKEYSLKNYSPIADKARADFIKNLKNKYPRNKHLHYN